MAELKLDPTRQIIGAQCSGALVLAKLGLLADVPACTDTTTKPWVEEAGVQVLDQPFVAHGNGWKIAQRVVHYVAPVGEKTEYVQRAFCSHKAVSARG